MQEKASEIEFLNRESNALQERANADEIRCKRVEAETAELRARLVEVQSELEKSRAEVSRLETAAAASVGTQTIGRASGRQWTTTTTTGVKRQQVDELDKTKRELTELRDKYAELSESVGGQVGTLNKEIERLNREKEHLALDLADLKAKYERALEINQRKGIFNFLIFDSLSIKLCFLLLFKDKKHEPGHYLSEHDQERILLEKLEAQTLNTKYEAKVQYLEVEIDTLRSKIRKLLKVCLLLKL